MYTSTIAIDDFIEHPGCGKAFQLFRNESEMNDCLRFAGYSYEHIREESSVYL